MVLFLMLMIWACLGVSGLFSTAIDRIGSV